MKTMTQAALALVLTLSLPACAGTDPGRVVDDTVLQGEVKSKLVADDVTGGLTINTEVRNGVVQLGGWVEKESEAREAGRVAASVDGVTKVDNQLHVERGERSSGQSVDDSVITSKVKTKIADADVGDGLKVNVDTHNGVVLLTGFVDSQDAKNRAAGIAASVEDVRDVVNGVYVMGRQG